MDGTSGFTAASPCSEMGSLGGLGYRADTRFPPPTASPRSTGLSSRMRAQPSEHKSCPGSPDCHLVPFLSDRLSLMNWSSRSESPFPLRHLLLIWINGLPLALPDPGEMPMSAKLYIHGAITTAAALFVGCLIRSAPPGWHPWLLTLAVTGLVHVSSRLHAWRTDSAVWGT
jgi:hypothetical protein